jgi:hypothetical protein
MLEPYITSVPGAQPARSSSVMQTQGWSSRGAHQVGCTVSHPSHPAIALSNVQSWITKRAEHGFEITVEQTQKLT